MNLTTELADDSEAAIGATNGMANPTIKIANVVFDEEQLANDEWFHMMQHKISYI